MNDSFLVRRFERIRDLLSNLERLLDRNRSSLEAFLQSFAFDKFHDEEVPAVGLIQTMQRRNVCVIQGSKHPGFPLKPGHALRVTSKLFGKKLDGNRPSKLRIDSLIHLAHTARSKAPSDLVMCEFGSDHA